jgi:hypothetical protein
MMNAETQRAIQESVERLLFTNGELERSAGRPLFKYITDGLLIEIRQAVRAAGDAVQPKPLSGLAQKRLMLRVVIDALRSPVVLDDAAALKAGDRIWKQAQRVSDAITSTAVEHASQRDAARAAAAADPNLAAGLAMELGAISAAEDTRCDKLRREVYIGLVEVAAVPDSSPAPAPLINPPKPHHDADISCMQELEDEYVLGWQACAHHFHGVHATLVEYGVRLQLREWDHMTRVFQREIASLERQLESAVQHRDEHREEMVAAQEDLEEELELDRRRAARDAAEIAGLRAQLARSAGEVRGLHTVIRDNCMAWKGDR